MARFRFHGLLPFLLLLFVGTLSNSAIVPFMGFFLIDGLGQAPWILSVYSGLAIALTVGTNRAFGRRIDGGAPVFPLIGLAAGGYALAALALSLSPSLPVMLTMGALGFGLSASAISTMFSLGGHLAEGASIDRPRFNAIMRATTSTAWMIGPALSFLAAGLYGPAIVFKGAMALGLLWLALWWTSLPRNATAKAPPRPVDPGTTIAPPKGLALAAAFVFCLSIAHGLTFSALPLFFTQEVGLPDFAPGTAFSVKTFVEVIAIFSTPVLMARFGLRAPLMAATLLAIGAILVLASVSTLPQMLFGAALEGLYYGLFASLGISYVQSFAPDRPAQATAMYWNALMISGLLAGPAVGLIAQISSFQTVIYTSSAVAALAALILLAGGRTRT
ncbi:MFS transporter [Hasllibacter sp. MH4015]|uniref:MFS transporter n=1 Tax=Hasllibacter sp. MH4015 TaxID=2854029 RepID=UPI001CD58B45